MKHLLKSILTLTLAGLVSACADHQFSQIESKPVENVNEEPETKGPSILVLKAPNSILGVTDEVAVEYQVVPGTAPIETIECVWNTKEVPCSPHKDRLLLLGGFKGAHKLKIKVTDKNGLSDLKSIPWELFEKFKRQQTQFQVSDSSNQLDVLFVVDNSPSMKDEQRHMARRFESFIERVKGFDWQVGIVTTDPSHHTYGDGRLQRFPSGRFVINSKMDIELVKEEFRNTIQRKEGGHSSEQGIRGTYRAIQRSLGSNSEAAHREFFREQSALNVVVISDENESGTQTENKGPELQKLIARTWGPEKKFRFHSIIVRPNDEACKAMAVGGDHYYGWAYYNLTKSTEGVLGNLCAEDYGNQLTLIGQSVANSKTTYDLECLPKDINNDGAPDVKVSATGVAKVPNFTISGKQIIFSQPPVVGQYTVDYFCPQD